MASQWPHCSRSARKTKARTATQSTSVLCRNAACGDEALDSPSKNSTNGTLPPNTPIAASAAHWPRPVRPGQPGARAGPEADADDGEQHQGRDDVLRRWCRRSGCRTP